MSRIEQLNQEIALHPDDEALWTERGSLYWKLQDWSRCLSDFDRAIALCPDGSAAHLKQSAMDIISFYNKDQYNP